jgi:cytochrome P450
MSLPTPALTTDPRGLIFITPDMYADMAEWHRIAAEIRRDEPVMRVEAEGWPAFWAITRHADVFEVSRRSDVFWNTEKSAPGPDLQYDMLQAMGIELPRTLVHIHGDAHQKLRNVTNDWFKPAAVKGLQPAIDAIADEYVDRLVDLGWECDFATDLAVPFTLRVIMSIFGVPQERRARSCCAHPGPLRRRGPRVPGRLLRPARIGHERDPQVRVEYFDELTADSRQATRPTTWRRSSRTAWSMDEPDG